MGRPALSHPTTMVQEPATAPEAKLLAGKSILVTGGSRGLGRAMCLRFAAEGARVAFTYARDEKAARATEDACRATSGAKSGATSGAAGGAAGGEASGGADRRVTCIRTDVLDAAGTAAFVSRLEREWGAIDALVNNAGLSHQLPLALLDEDDFDAVMDTNVKGTFLTTRAVVRGMIRRRGGAILNIGSLAGVRMIEAPVHYCASKAALTGLTQSLAKELARYGIRVNCLAPGLLEDGLGRNLPDYRLAEYIKHCALGRVGTFDEVARFAAFLVSDRNSYMNGATVVMDGCV